MRTPGTRVSPWAATLRIGPNRSREGGDLLAQTTPGPAPARRPPGGSTAARGPRGRASRSAARPRRRGARSSAITADRRSASGSTRSTARRARPRCPTSVRAERGCWSTSWRRMQDRTIRLRPSVEEVLQRARAGTRRRSRSSGQPAVLGPPRRRECPGEPAARAWPPRLTRLNRLNRGHGRIQVGVATGWSRCLTLAPTSSSSSRVCGRTRITAPRLSPSSGGSPSSSAACRARGPSRAGADAIASGAAAEREQRRRMASCEAQRLTIETACGFATERDAALREVERWRSAQRERRHRSLRAGSERTGARGGPRGAQRSQEQVAPEADIGQLEAETGRLDSGRRAAASTGGIRSGSRAHSHRVRRPDPRARAAGLDLGRRASRRPSDDIDRAAGSRAWRLGSPGHKTLRTAGPAPQRHRGRSGLALKRIEQMEARAGAAAALDGAPDGSLPGPPALRRDRHERPRRSAPRPATALAAEIRERLGPPPRLTAWPPVSIVVPTRDGLAHVERLVAGLSERTDYPELELIVVDNASSDGTLELLARAASPVPGRRRRQRRAGLLLGGERAGRRAAPATTSSSSSTTTSSRSSAAGCASWSPPTHATG